MSKKRYICAENTNLNHLGSNRFVYYNFLGYKPSYLKDIPDELQEKIDEYFNFQSLAFSSDQDESIFDFLHLWLKDPKTRKLAELLYIIQK